MTRHMRWREMRKERADKWLCQYTYDAKAQDHADPEEHVIGRLVGADPARVLQHHDRELEHLADEAVTAQLFGNASHDNFMAEGGDQEGDEGGIASADAGFRGRVHVAPQE